MGRGGDGVRTRMQVNGSAGAARRVGRRRVDKRTKWRKKIKKRKKDPRGGEREGGGKQTLSASVTPTPSSVSGALEGTDAAAAAERPTSCSTRTAAANPVNVTSRARSE